MFYIKSDDVDELFREAAEKYQIDTTEAEAWDDVQAAVHADDLPPATPPEGKKRRRWFVFAWLLLIPLGWFAHNMWNALSSTAPKNNPGIVTKTVQPQAATGETQKNKPSKEVNYTNQTAVATNPGGNTNNELQTNVTKGKSLAAEQRTNHTNVRQALAAGNDVNTRARAGAQSPGSFKFSSRTAPAVAANAGDVDKAQDNRTGDVQQGALNDGKKVDAPLLPANNNAASDTLVNADNKPSITDNKQSVLNPPAENVNAVNKPAQTKSRDKEKASRYFYLGLSVSPDVSFIHFQKTSTIGVGAGLLLGYHINNKFSIETGLLFDKKNYYTAGKYFDKSKLPYGNNIKLVDVDGYCKMAEIPLNLRYTFKNNQHNRFYAVAGLSSYLMSNEYYNYGYYWGTNYYDKTYSTNKSLKYWFSIVNIGAGFEHSLGAKTNVRIEPYMKLPLAGVGTGNISISSTGLYLSLTRKLP
jgi:hypothetical protein